MKWKIVILVVLASMILLAFQKKVLPSIFYRLLAPGYSACHRCNMPWRFVKEHITNYSEERGMFPLCENCWKSLTPKERLPYYRQLYNEWNQPGIWPQIEKAVMAEK